MTEALKSNGIKASPVLLRGDAASEIIEYVKSHEIDLLAASSRGLSAVRGWLLGSVSRLRRALNADREGRGQPADQALGQLKKMHKTGCVSRPSRKLN